MPEIVAIAAALEREAVDRYAALSMALSEGEHPEDGCRMATIGREAARRAESLCLEAQAMGMQVPWTRSTALERLPDAAPEPEPDEMATQSLYRALAWAVANEQQGFRLFSYLAAHAADAAAGARAEALAQDKLAVAARLRRERRCAYREERASGRPDILALAARISGAEDLRAAAWVLEDSIATCLAWESQPCSLESLRLTRELIAMLGVSMEGDESVARAVGGLVDRGGDRAATLRSLDRAFGFYDAVSSRAASEETLFLAQRLAQVSLDRIGILRESDAAPSASEVRGAA